MPSLIIYHDESRQDIELEDDTYTIGRDPGNQLVLDDARVSRFHCRLSRADAGYQIEDLGSTAGTVLDGQPVGCRKLKPGQTFIIGSARITYEDEEAEVEPAGTTGTDVEYGLYFDGGSRAGTVAVFSESIKIGRAPGCDLILDGHSISSYHCEVIVGPNGVTMQDLGSTNGTSVNEQTIDRIPLMEDDRVEIGEHRAQFSRHPLPTPEPAPGPAFDWSQVVELTLFAVIGLLLWALLARLVLRQLVVPQQTPEQAGVITFEKLGDDNLPVHYRFALTGKWEINVVRGESGGLRVKSNGDQGQQLRVITSDAFPANLGWRVSGRAEGIKGAVRTSLFAQYGDARGEEVALIYSPAERLVKSAIVMEHQFPPLPGAATVRFGYLVEGNVREALLGPLKLTDKTNIAPLHPVTLKTSWGEMTLESTGRFTLDPGGGEILSGEFGTMSEGRIESSTRSFMNGLLSATPSRAILQSEQVGPGPMERHQFRMELKIDDDAMHLQVVGAKVVHMRWDWLSDTDSVRLFYRSAPRSPSEKLPLLDEMSIRRGDQELTVVFKPPVYRESRWEDAHGTPFWQLKFVEGSAQRSLEIYSGNRRRDREISSVRSRYERAVDRQDWAEALKQLYHWRALVGNGPNPALTKQTQQIHRKVDRVVEDALSSSGESGRKGLEDLLTRYRGTHYEERLEAELARRLLTDIQGSQRTQTAKDLLYEARYLAAHGYLQLARVELQLLIQQFPETNAANAALKLLALIPSR